MRLRNLESKDAPLMLEWMHDLDVVGFLKTDFQTKTLEDCLHFINKAKEMETDIHLAIADDLDVYQGTVSLKHIANEKAEFAITLRKSAMGTGIAKVAMREIIEYGFYTLNLKTIYWCVNPLNLRAVRFYNKCGYSTTTAPIYVIGYEADEIHRMIWYEVKA